MTRPLPRLLLGILILTAAGAGFAVTLRPPPAPTPAASEGDVTTASIEDQVRAYFDIQLQITIIPAGAQPGHLTAADKTELQARVFTELPNVMTGELLSTQSQGFYDYFSALARTDTAIVVLGGGVDSMSFDGAPIIVGNTATASGTYVSHSSSYHLAAGQRVSDSFRAATSFTAQLTQAQGAWLLNSMSTTLLSTEPTGW